MYTAVNAPQIPMSLFKAEPEPQRTHKVSRIKVGRDIYAVLNQQSTIIQWEYAPPADSLAPARTWPAEIITDVSDIKRRVHTWITQHRERVEHVEHPAVKQAREDVARVMARYGQDPWTGERGVLRDYLW